MSILSDKKFGKGAGGRHQPLDEGAANVPVIMQMETLECGAASLAMIMAYFGKWVPLEQVRRDCGVSRDGSNMKNLVMAARSYGLEAKAFRMEPEGLKHLVKYPCILHWNFNHFVVLDGFRRGKAVINDPAQGRMMITMEELDNAFTGVCLSLTPGEEFEPSGRRKSMLEFAGKRLKGASAAVMFIVLTSVIAYLFGVINPVMSRIFFDRLLTGESPEWLRPFILVMACLCIFQLIVEWTRTIYNLKINGKMAIEGSASYMWKVLRLPMDFFSQRMAGDILMRQETNAAIAGTLVNTLAPLGLNTGMMILYLAVMLRNSPALTLVGLASLALNIIVARWLSAKRVNLTRVKLRDEGKLNSTTISGISQVETIKSAGAEAGFFRKWAGYQAAVNTQEVRYLNLDARIGMIPGLVTSLSNYAVLFLGVLLAMQGNLTLGTIFFFQGLLTSFMDPAMTLVNAGQTIQEMRTQMERVEDVMNYPEDPLAQDTPLREDEDYAKLKGKIEVKNVSFGYSPLDDPIITDFSMTLEPGSRVAIVGGSGCGKSTVSKLVAGLSEPWSGEILFDGKPIREIPRAVFTSSVAMVDQEIVLFEDTIAANIRMWDSTIEDFEVIMAAKDAQIHEDIIQRPGGYRSKLIENGRDLSGGQRQRLEIARVLAQDPSIIIMDEATSALDALTEYELVKAVKNRGITCIVVAHRLSTIRDCDEIIVLDKGRVAERGTHEELYAKGGLYTELIQSE